VHPFSSSPTWAIALVRSRVSNPKWAAIHYTTFERFDRCLPIAVENI
jgi:hypothetical protein